MESTSYVSTISYDIEDWWHDGLKEGEIIDLIKELQKDEEFPKNLEYVGSYYDKKYSISGCAFKDTNTGEIIMGMAGTNIDVETIKTPKLIKAILPLKPNKLKVVTNKSASLKDLWSDFLLAGGTKPDSARFDETNKFIKKLKSEGYDITWITGHSLGGSLVESMGIEHQIPNIVAYNGAGLYYLLGSDAQAIKEKVEQYNGNYLGFESNRDIVLGPISPFAVHIGENYTIENGKGHGIAGFKLYQAQNFILDKKLEAKLNRIKVEKIKFINNGKEEMISLNDNDLKIENLLGDGKGFDSKGEKIVIDPEAFYSLKNNLEVNIIQNDIAWIRNSIIKCKEINDRLEYSKDQRDSTLYEAILDVLNNLGLIKLLRQIDLSHGVLEKDYKNIIMALSEFDISTIKNKLSGNGWHLDGAYLDKETLYNEVRELQQVASDLYLEIISTNSFEAYGGIAQGNTLYRYETMSSIGDAYVNLTNSFADKTQKAFEGTGLRAAKKDGIVNAISEVLEVELKNLEKLEKQIGVIAEIAGGIGENFEGVDTWLASAIEEKVSARYEFNTLPTTYKEYLEEHSILNDVKDILEAYDLQVENSTFELTNHIAYNFADLISITRPKLISINEGMYEFKEIIDKLDFKLNDEVTRVEYGKTTEIGYNEWEREKIEERYGALATFFPQGIQENIQISKSNIFPIIDDLEDTSSELNTYEGGLYSLRDNLNFIIEKAVYDSQELSSIIEIQKLIGAKIEVMIREFRNVQNVLGEAFEGNTIMTYQGHIGEILALLRYFNVMLEDCFWGSI